MGRWGFLLVFCFIVFTHVLISSGPVQASEPISSYILSDLHYETYPEFSRVIFASNDKTDFVSYELDNPHRIVIDLLGVSFCELQEHVDYDEGLVESIDIIKTPYAKNPQGLDEYFYPVDYIVVTPRSNFPHTISQSEDSRVIALDIGEKKRPEVKVSNVFLTPPDAELSGTKPDKKERPDIRDQLLLKDSLDTASAGFLPEIVPKAKIIDYMNIESVDDSTLLMIGTNYDVTFQASRGYYPVFNIVIRPEAVVFTDLEESVTFDSGYIKSLSIIRNEHIPLPEGLDEYFYAIEYIVVEPTVDLPFDFYASQDNTISILEIYYPEIKEEVRGIIDEETERQNERSAFEKEEEDKLKEAAKTELLQLLKEEIRKEDFLKEEKIKQLKEAEIEKRKIETARKVERIGQEAIKDLIVKGQGTLDLSRSQAIAIENSTQAIAAREEVKLSMLKKRDTFRALFPNLKLKASHTVGDIYDDVGFTEEVYGIEGEHPLYQGGRLMNAYKQSKINVDLAHARYNKIEHELNFKVAEAYHSVATAIMNLRLQQQLLSELEPIFKLAEKRYASGLSTNLEMLNVQSRYNQVQFQAATAERDLALARFKLEQAMGLDMSKDVVDISEVSTELPFKIIDIDLYECLDAAAYNHPDIVVNKLVTESSEFSEKIAKGKEGFRIDLTGFYGQADSYYKTEAKNLEPDWNVGVKISKPFWFASPSYSFTKERTSRKVGQTDRTGSTVNAGELSILDKDALALGSEIEEARLAKLKAENELIEARRQSALTVKEAYYNYQEAVIQVRNSLEKVKFHEEGVKVARIQAELNESLQSQLLESIIQLADEKSVYIKALSDYNLAIIKLNNAIGIKDYFKVD
jgi:outer membrane protein TolC